MNALVVCLSAVLPSVSYQAELSGIPDSSQQTPFISLVTADFAERMEEDASQAAGAHSTMPSNAQTLFKSREPEILFRGQSPMGYPPVGGDPFLQPPGTMDPYAGLPGGGFLYGANGPQPFRMGIQPRLDMFYTPEEMTSNGTRFESWGFDFQTNNTQPSALFQGAMFSMAPRFGMRHYDGPKGLGMPGRVFRTGLDLKWETPQTGPMSMVLGFNPSINSDFKDGLNSDAFNWDGYGLLIYQLSPTWRAVAGAGYWDRVRDRVIPYAGLIYHDDLFEMKLTFPEAQISMFVGNELGCAKWLYFRGEYHVESYAIEGVSGRDQVEVKDYRILFGTKMDSGRVNWHLEGGYIFDRDVRFKSGSSNFGVDTGFITQFGVRF